MGLPRRHHRRDLLRPDRNQAAGYRGSLSDQAAELGRRDPHPGRVGQCRLPGRCRACPQVRRRGHRPDPHRAHVLRDQPPAGGPAHDPGQDRSRARRGPGDLAALPAQRLRRPVPGDGRPARHDPPDRPADARVPALAGGAAGRGDRAALHQAWLEGAGREGIDAIGRSGHARVQPHVGPARRAPGHPLPLADPHAGARDLRSGL